MNLMRYRNIKYVCATLVCAAGVFTASFALAGKSGGGYSHYYKQAEFERVECSVEGGRIEVWGKVEGPADYAKVVLDAKGEAETDCINPGNQKVEAQGDRKWFDIYKTENVGELGKYDKEPFDIHAQVETHAKCKGKANWKAKTRLDFKNDEFTVKLLDRGDLVDEATCEVNGYYCDCYLSGGGYGKW